MEIVAPKQDSVDKKPRIIIEQWVNIADSQARHSGLHLYKNKTCKLADPIPNDEKMEIPLCAFLDAPFPGELDDNCHLILDSDALQVILNEIANTWDEEAAGTKNSA